MDIIKVFVEYLAAGGQTSVIAILGVVLGYFVWDRKELVKLVSDTTQKVYDAKDAEKKVILEIVDKYYQGNTSVSQALAEIKMVLQIIQSKI
jgi:hypothetical protein